MTGLQTSFLLFLFGLSSLTSVAWSQSMSSASLEKCLDKSQALPDRFVACRSAAEEGFPDAQVHLGDLYDWAHVYPQGAGIPDDDTEAVRWYRMAAELGDAMSQQRLGDMYADGRGVPENDMEAVKWYRLAAEQGYDRAQLDLGDMFIRGEGVPGDYVQAYVWYNLAAAQGNEEAALKKDKLAKWMTRDQVQKAQSLSSDLFRRISGRQ
ncbi:MAG: tetratricopeptide repeat protein [Gemmatimonadetes bacterium]|nr:tetratricopeptide repeat protein [Gemmatimonadota bacterium]